MKWDLRPRDKFYRFSIGGFDSPIIQVALLYDCVILENSVLNGLVRQIGYRSIGIFER